MKLGRAILAALGLCIIGPATSAAQVSNDLVSRAVRAYNDVDLDAAVGFLRRWFASSDAASAALDDRRQALTYLGAAEILRSNRDSGTAAFERLVRLDPRYRVDELLFPPEVSTLFSTARQRTKAVAVELPPEVRITGDGGAYSLRMFASSAHFLEVEVRRLEGPPLRSVYTGPIGDSLEVQWDGRDSAGTPLPTGRYFLEVRSGAFRNIATRVLQIPLEIATTPADTTPLPPPPPDSLRLPETRPPRPGVEALLGGMLAGAAIALLPAVLAPGAEFVPARFAVAGVLGGTGLIGFVHNLPGRGIPANRRVNDQRQQDWQTQVAAITAENRRRRLSGGLVVRSGDPVIVDLTER